MNQRGGWRLGVHAEQDVSKRPPTTPAAEATMTSVKARILEHSRRLPEGAIVSPGTFRHLGSPASVSQALSRLAREGKLLRISQRNYLQLKQTRFGTRAPSIEQILSSLSQMRRERITRSGAAAAHALGLTTQQPIRHVHLTSGPSRKLEIGRQSVELQRAPRWMLWRPNEPAGDVVRALAWLGEQEATRRAHGAIRQLDKKERRALRSAADHEGVPAWLRKLLMDELEDLKGQESVGTRHPG